MGVGLHGDHVGGELDAANALKDRQVAATWMLDFNFERWTKDGTRRSSNSSSTCKNYHH